MLWPSERRPIGAAILSAAETGELRKVRRDASKELNELKERERLSMSSSWRVVVVGCEESF